MGSPPRSLGRHTAGAAKALGRASRICPWTWFTVSSSAWKSPRSTRTCGRPSMLRTFGGPICAASVAMAVAWRTSCGVAAMAGALWAEGAERADRGRRAGDGGVPRASGHGCVACACACLMFVVPFPTSQAQLKATESYSGSARVPAPCSCGCNAFADRRMSSLALVQSLEDVCPAHARCAGHPNRYSGHPSQCFTPGIPSFGGGGGFHNGKHTAHSAMIGRSDGQGV